MTKSQASTTTGGMSRAAKKRAKKKQKHYKQQVVETASNDGAKNVEECAKKRPLVEQEGAPKPEQPRKKFKNDSPKEQDPVHVMIQEVLSKLTPLQILQLTKLDDNNQEATIMGEQVNVSDLLQETTTQQRARALFQSLLGNTVSLKEFYDDYWEKQPLYISAADDAKSRFDGILTKAEMKQQLETHPAYYGKDLNVTRYEEGTDGVKRRITLDPQPDQDEEFCLVDVKDAWENYQSGCSLRLLCPHKHNDALHALLSMLEFEWSCMVGANVYLTPPGSQGFAPHYDDIEAFCIQLEGHKHWKVYPPLNKRETLPRESSSDYTEDDLKSIEPVLDVVLGPGDILYMPRGWIHQAVTTNRQGHSLHLTISAMQQWAWVDFLELLMPEALEAAAASDISTSLREGLPLRFLDYMGAVHDDTSDDLPEGLKNNAQNGDTKSHGKDDNEAESGDDDEALEASKIKALRESFREEAKKRIMRVSKEVSNRRLCTIVHDEHLSIGSYSPCSPHLFQSCC
jgi:lysine-specific demethylase/histidyl-hydroxylase NO66